MRNIKLIIEYDGSRYCGWQVQGGGKSIQGVIEKVLRKITGEKVRLIASGRTDAGVHAVNQVANFKISKGISAQKLKKALNGLLPEDISITDASDAPLGFHSRFDAVSKIYRYLILNRPYPSALTAGRMFHCPYLLNVALMKKEAGVLLGRHDFSAFCASKANKKCAVRAIKNIDVRPMAHLPLAGAKDAGHSVIAITVESDGFLYNMVRNIAGTLVEIGRGRFPAGSMKRILLSKDRGKAGPTLPAHGLYLVKVKY